MELKSRIIVGLSGQKGVGKDLVANIIDYIVRNKIRNANYKDWFMQSVSDKNKELITVTHFADPLKSIIASLFNIDVKYFYNREYKDNKYIKLYDYTRGNCTIAKAFINENEAINKNYLIVDNEKLLIHSLSYYIIQPNMCIKLRTLLQYIGTEVGRKIIDDELWINLSINNISRKATANRLCIIPDVRFNNEAEIIRKLGGKIIKIERNIESNKKDKHDSENMNDVIEDYLIDNNGTKFNLFYKVFSIIDTIYKEQRNKVENKN